MNDFPIFLSQGRRKYPFPLLLSWSALNVMKPINFLSKHDDLGLRYKKMSGYVLCIWEDLWFVKQQQKFPSAFAGAHSLFNEIFPLQNNWNFSLPQEKCENTKKFCQCALCWVKPSEWGVVFCLHTCYCPLEPQLFHSPEGPDL